MFRFLFTLIVLAVIGLGGSYVGSAWYRSAQTLEALNTADAAALAQRVDFDKLKADLKPQLEAQVEKFLDSKADAVASDSNNPLGGLIRAIGLDRAAMAVAARSAIPKVLEQVGTPEGLARLAAQQLKTDPDAPKPTFPEYLGASAALVQPQTLDAMLIKLADPRAKSTEAPITLEITRSGPFDWKVTGATLPEDFVTRTIEASLK
jgi:hypothetical protein